MWIIVFIIPVLFVWCPIVFSFDPKLTLKQKVCYFFILPVIELIISIFAFIQARSIDINLLQHWQLYLIYFLFSLGMASTLMVTLLEELYRTIKLILRVLTLIVLGFILTWLFFGVI